MTKRQALVQLTQLNPEERDDEESEHTSEVNIDNVQNGSMIDPELMAKRAITKPMRPSARLGTSSSTMNGGALKPFGLSFTSQTPALLTPPMTTQTFTVVKDQELHMRGLNVSFQQHIQKLLDKNPSCDLGAAFETYTKHKKTIQNKDSADAPSNRIQEPQNVNPIAPIDPPKPLSPTFTAISSTPTTVPPVFPTFGSTSTQPQLPSFEAPKAQISSPFAFASTSQSTTTPGFGGWSFGQNTTGFSFSAPTKPETTPASTSNQDQEDESGEDTEQVPEQKIVVDPYIQGPGEENEKTVFAQRCKLYSMHSETKKWIDLGICSLRINQHKETNKKRLLIKSQDATSKVLCNFFIFSEFHPELVEKTNSVMFLGMNPDNKPTKYLLRVKTTDQAKELNDNLVKSIPQ
jgi:hypothetical protein